MCRIAISWWLLFGLGMLRASEPGDRGWPNWRGAGCNGAASEKGIEYVASLNDAKLLWTSAALCEDYIVFGSTRNGSETRGLTCFRITPEKAEQVWSQETALETDTPSPCIFGEHVYAIRTRNKKASGGLRGTMAFLCIELATGKIVANEVIGGTAGASRPDRGCDGCSSLFAFDGRICYRGANKACGGQVVVRDAAPKKVVRREFFKPQTYNVAATPAMAEGKLFLRGMGHIVCYDLRRK